MSQSASAKTNDCTRLSPEPRVLDVSDSQGAAFGTTCTIAVHLYRGPYYPGSHPRVEDATRGRARLEGSALVLDLGMDEPDLEAVLQGLAAQREKDEDFFDAEYVSFNLLDAEGCVIQAGLKADGRAGLWRGGRTLKTPKGFAEIRRDKRRWHATVRLPLRTLGLTRARLADQPLAFDLVRQHAATGAITAWCPIPDHRPFVELYDIPVFCFGLLADGPVDARVFAAPRKAIGKVRYQGPKAVQAGAFARFSLVYTVGRHGLAPGGAVRFNLANEVIECNRNSPSRRHLPEKDWTPLQWERPQDAGFVSVSCSRPRASFHLSRANVFAVTARLHKEPALKPGDIVTIDVGQDKRGPGVRAQLLTQTDVPVKISADPVGNRIFHELADAPRVDVRGRRAMRLLVHAPPTPKPGARFRLQAVAVDDLGNVADGFQGKVRLHSPVGLKGLPATYTFRKRDRGVARFTVSTRSRAVFVVTAAATGDATLNGASNLIVTDGSFGPDPIFFGDIHTHSQLSDGRLHPMAKAREVGEHRGCDFWALADHCHDMTPDRVRLWQETLDRFLEAGRFVTLPAYEWTGSMGLNRPWAHPVPGHRNVYLRAPVDVLPDGVWRRSRTVPKLVRQLVRTGEDFFLITHFHCGDPTVLPKYDRAMEISGWAGDHIRETPGTAGGKTSVQQALAKGAFLGVVAGSDHGTEAYYTGLPAELTGIRAKALTREALYDALERGATYGTTGQKTLLRLQVNGREPGDRPAPVRAKRRTLTLTVGAAVPVVQAQIVKNGRVFENFPGASFGVQTYQAVDAEPTPASGYYYARVRTPQGHYAWSSPVFYARGR